MDEGVTTAGLETAGSAAAGSAAAGFDGSELVTRRSAGDGETAWANRRWWDANADEYQADHGEFLGDSRFLWGPEGVYEDKAHLLGPVHGKRVLEVGCGAAQCSRWLVKQGAQVAGFDLSMRQLEHAQRMLLDPRSRDLPIGEISARSGLADPSHFSRRFRQRYGVRPTQLRRSVTG